MLDNAGGTRVVRRMADFVDSAKRPSPWHDRLVFLPPGEITGILFLKEGAMKIEKYLLLVLVAFVIVVIAVSLHKTVH
jgi:hypothetical protein